MRAFLHSAVVLVAAGMISGCFIGAKSAQPTTTAVDKVAAGKTWLMQSGGADVLKVTAAPEFKCVAADGSLHFASPQFELEIWLVNGASTVDDAAGRVSTQIVSEFKDFKAEKTISLTVAGSPAKELVGTGHEADDNDPGDADVIVFKVGDHVFVACNHGESLTPAGQQGLSALVQTASVP